MVHIYIADITPLQDRALFERLYRFVIQDRRDKIDRYLPEKSKQQSLAAGVLLQKAISDFGIENPKIVYGANKKPYLEGNAVFFNLSHSGERVMCAVSKSEVGCDVQKIKPVGTALAQRFFAESEISYLLGFEGEAQKTEFFRLWTLKESFIKATGQGMALSLKDFSVVPSKDGITVDQSYDQKTYYFKEYDLQDGYRYAVCAQTPDFAKKIRVVDLHDPWKTEN